MLQYIAILCYTTAHVPSYFPTHTTSIHENAVEAMAVDLLKREVLKNLATKNNQTG